MTTNKTRYYTLYMYDKNNNDIINLYETTSRQKASEKLDVTDKHFSEYCVKAKELLRKKGEIKLPRLQATKYFIVIDTD